MMKVLFATSASTAGYFEIRTHLSKEGIEVVCAEDGRSATQILEAHEPDLALVDRNLEGMDGLAVVGWVKDHVKLHRIPVILLVDPVDLAVPDFLVDSGAVDFCLKPLQIQELMARIQLIGSSESSLSAKFLDGDLSRMAIQERVAQFLQQHRDREEELLGLFFMDPETGLNNRAYFKIKLSEELKRSQRYGAPLSSLVIKLCGSEDVKPPSQLTIKEIASILLLESRDLDIIGRYGDSDFSMLLPNTVQDGAVLLAQRISERIITYPFTDNSGGRDFQVRIGIATYPIQGVKNARDFMNRAYDALSKAQNFGTKEICIWESGTL